MPEFTWDFGQDDALSAPDDGDVLQQPPEAEPPPPRRSRRAEVWLGLTTLLLLGLVGYFVLYRPTEQAEERSRAEVLAIQQTIWAADAQAGGESLTPILTLTDHQWVRNQKYLAGLGRLIGRDPFGLQALRGETRLVAVELAPDLSEARVAVEQAYRDTTGVEPEAAIWLEHVTFYRFERGGWRWAAPDEAFWGEPQTTRGEYLNLSYPARDAEVSARLARDLDQLLAEVCSRLAELNCDSSTPVEVKFDSQPDLLSPPGAPESTSWSIGPPPTLPAPSLMGVPSDDTSYRAIYRAYAQRMLHWLFLRAGRLWFPPVFRSWMPEGLLGRELVELGLAPWPEPASGANSMPPAIPPPDQPIWVPCVESLTEGTLYRYQPASEAWTPMLTGRGISSVVPMQDGGLLLEELASREGALWRRESLWRSGREQLLLESPFFEAFDTYLWSDSTGRHLFLSTRLPIGWDERLLDLGRCDSTGCESVPLPGVTVWSPDGTQTLVVTDDGEILRGDAEAQALRPIGTGTQAAWISDQVYAYLRRSPPNARWEAADVVVASADDDHPSSVLNVADLLGGRPESEQVELSDIHQAAIGAAGSNRFVVSLWLGSLQPNLKSVSFVVDAESGWVERTIELDGAPYVQWISPDWRWLATVRTDGASGEVAIEFLDLDSGETWAFDWPASRAILDTPSRPSGSWAADGRWLMASWGGSIRLVAPAQRYQRAVAPPVPGCGPAVWGR